MNYAEAKMLIRKPATAVFEAFIDPALTKNFWFTKSSGKLEVNKRVTWEWEMYNISTPVTVKEILKNKRIAKIKSKLYHKIKKRDKDREEKKLLEYLEQIDPEAAEAYRMKEEQKKVEERLKLRHSSDNRFAKKLKRFGNMEDKSVREAFNDMMKEKNQLKSRTKTTR